MDSKDVIILEISTVVLNLRLKIEELLLKKDKCKK